MNSETFGDARWSNIGAPLAAEAVPSAAEQGQYSLRKIATIWAAAALPMAFLGWIAAPLIGDRIDLGVGHENREALTRALLLTIGLVWQFVLAMGIVLREEGDLRWSTIRRRCWLNSPRDRRDGRARSRLWLMLVPILLVAVIIQLAPLTEFWEKALPFLGEPDQYSFTKLMESEERKAAMEGAWQVLGLFVVLGIFNTIIGEELLFRGILLPKMGGVFGKGDWLANGVIFGLYHLHQPWGIPRSIATGVLCYAFPSRRYRSAWMGIIVHSAETAFFIFAALGLVLGLA
ncbi:MAG: CPBP family intramembrane glutamic endopeptidase [Dehalococcoidia bacterium]